MPYAVSLIQDIEWVETSDTPFTLEFTDPSNPKLKFKIVGADGGANPHSYLVTVTREGDDYDNGTATRVRQLGVVSTLPSTGITPRQAITSDMFRRIEDWCKQQRQEIMNRPPAGLGKSPYTPGVNGY